MKKLEVNCYPNSQSYLLWQVIAKGYTTRRARAARSFRGLPRWATFKRCIQTAIDEHNGDMGD